MNHTESHLFNDIYETIQKNSSLQEMLGSINPRAVTIVMTDIIDPKLGEMVFLILREDF